MSKKDKEVLDLTAEIKKMEDAKRVIAPPKRDNQVSFNSWYHQRKASIPKQHMKEIIWADFVARGIKSMSTMEEFDKALGLYGIKL